MRQRLATLMMAIGCAIAAAPARADCPAANKYSFSFTGQATASLSYANSYTYTATNTAGQSMTFTVSFTVNGQASNVSGGIAMPAISNHINNGTGNFLNIGGILSGRTASITGATNLVVTTFTFPSAVRDVTALVADIDYTNNQYRDWLMVTGKNGAASYTPLMVTPFGQQNNGTLTNASSSLTLGPTAAPFAVTASQAVGTGAATNGATTGNVTSSLVQPITAIEFRYGNYPYQTGENTTGQQAMGIEGVSFCPMPSLTVAKTSAPWSDPRNGTTNPKLIPGGDLIYTLTVTNSNTSPVDLSTTVLTDPLPANVIFYNGDIDDAGPLTTNYDFNAGTSGLTFAAANLTYSNNGGTSYAYTPAAGYDAAVTALRFAPTGSMAANSSFTLKFRARIK